jgi:phospholipid/cholesterol/gamma-HCH transport system ATP-binding protein
MPHVAVSHLTMAYDDFVVQNDLSFEINRGEVFIIMGGSGCGKSTLLRHLIGLKEPISGEVYFDGMDLWHSKPRERNHMLLRMGILYQSGALWSSMTLRENISLPLSEHTTLTPGDIEDMVALKLALVGLAGFEDFYPSEISGGMQKRAALARAMALDPEILFFDEPSAGLDPISARRLDELILHLKESLGTTVVIVTHDLDSILEIGSDSVFLDTDAKTIIARGNPKDILANTEQANVREFLTRGKVQERTSLNSFSSNPSRGKQDMSI